MKKQVRKIWVLACLVVFAGAAVAAEQEKKAEADKAQQTQKNARAQGRFNFIGTWEMDYNGHGIATLVIKDKINYPHWYFPEGEGEYISPRGEKLAVKWRVPDTTTQNDRHIVLFIIGLDHDNPHGRFDMRFDGYMFTGTKSLGRNKRMAGTFNWRDKISGWCATKKE